MSQSSKSQSSESQSPKNVRTGNGTLLDVQLPLRSPVGTVLAAWLVPGLGHFLLGSRARGTAFAVLVLGSLLFGAALDGRMPWIFSGSPLFILMTFGAMGSGAAYFFLRFSGFTGDPAGWGFDYGGAFIVTAGLMNLLLLLDVYDICWGKELVDPEVADGLKPAYEDDETAAAEGAKADADADQDAAEEST